MLMLSKIKLVNALVYQEAHEATYVAMHFENLRVLKKKIQSVLYFGPS